uniref:Cystatin fetuin-A-type domain-containing protein n=1 Tax=Pseudonaja textilis TaxID=8673 RepID=A0A670Z472_PSETE
MNSLVTLVLLGQIIGCTFSVLLIKEFDCNGEEAKKFGDLAVDYINQHNLHGYKQTLNVIKRVDFLAPRPRVISVELDVLETTCHVLDPTPVENCTVRQQDHHVSV